MWRLRQQWSLLSEMNTQDLKSGIVKLAWNSTSVIYALTYHFAKVSFLFQRDRQRAAQPVFLFLFTPISLWSFVTLLIYCILMHNGSLTTFLLILYSLLSKLAWGIVTKRTPFPSHYWWTFTKVILEKIPFLFSFFTKLVTFLLKNKNIL